MIKPWKDRVEEAAHFREEDYINDVQYFMQEEIGELRAENARLRAALALCLSSLQYAWGCIENSTEQEDAKIEIGLDAARAALGEK